VVAGIAEAVAMKTNATETAKMKIMLTEKEIAPAGVEKQKIIVSARK
jgi:hypothetical protein